MCSNENDPGKPPEPDAPQSWTAEDEKLWDGIVQGNENAPEKPPEPAECEVWDEWDDEGEEEGGYDDDDVPKEPKLCSIDKFQESTKGKFSNEKVFDIPYWLGKKSANKEKVTMLDSVKSILKNKWVLVIVLGFAALLGSGAYSDQIKDLLILVLGG